MSRLTRDGTAEPVSRDQILRHVRGQGNIHFPVQLTTSRIGSLTRLIHTLLYRRYFQHAHFIPIVGVGKRGEYELVHGDLPRQHPFRTTLRFTGPVPADLGSERHRYAIA